MTSAKLGVQRSSFAELWSRLERERALNALCQGGRRVSFGLRAARYYAVGIFVGYALAIALSRGQNEGALGHGFVHAALIALSFGVGAPAALGAAQGLAEQPEREATEALARQAGFSQRSLSATRTLSMAVRIARLVAIPALLLVALAVHGTAELPWAAAVAPAVIVYSSLLGLGLSLLAHVSAALSARHPRAVLLGLVLTTLLLSQAYPEVPNVISFYSSLLRALLSAGAQLS